MQDADEKTFTIDAFHRGRLHLVQPAGRGHRAGLDAMLLASAVPGNFEGRLADLGAGTGAAGLAVAARCAKVRAILVENNAMMADLARRTLALPGNASLAGRCRLIEADVLLRGRERAAAGLQPHSQDFVIFNPPFNEPADRGSPDPLRRAAHVMPKGGIEGWIRTAAAILRPGGRVAIITRPSMLQQMFEVMSSRFGSLELKPVHAQRDRPAIRVIIRAVSGSRGPLRILPPLFLHKEGAHAFTEEATGLINGETCLFGD